MITLKAISPDNIVEIRELLELFSAHSDYAGLAPEDESFFTKRVLGRFTSLLIKHDDELIGHLAIMWDRRCPSEVQLILPLLVPKAANHINEIGESLTKMLVSLARRQSWHNLSCLIPLSQIHVQEFLVTYCGAPVYGLCPALAGSKNPQAPRYTGALFCHQFSEGKSARNLVVPEQHLAISKYLLENDPHLSVQRAEDVDPTSVALPAERKSIERLNLPKTGILYSFVSPSLLTNKKNGIDELLNVDCAAHFVLVDMEDTKCPTIADSLESRNLKFCGLAPFVRNRHSMIYAYCPENISLLDSCHAPRAQVLAHYINSYNLPESIKAAKTSPIVKRSVRLENAVEVATNFGSH